MFSFLATLMVLALAKYSVALPSLSPLAPSSDCVDLRVPITIDANNTLWDVPRVDSNIDAVDFVWSLAERSAPSLSQITNGTYRVQQTFTIHAQLCVPRNGSKSNILQIATHGGNVGSAYWDPALDPDQYSYVYAALQAGYSILWYDRLGCGESDKPDAYRIVQAPAQVEILRQLTILARNDQLISSSQTQSSLSSVPKFDKIVLIGHSWGSVISGALVAQYPSLANGIVLTGFAPNKYIGIVGQQEFGIIYAPTAGPAFHDRSSGYLVSTSESNVQLNFFKKGYFDPAMLAYATSIKDTATVGEVLTLAVEVATFKAPQFAGPVLMAIGEHDYVVCDGDCNGVANATAIKSAYFPSANDVTVYVHPGSGHALTLHYNATGHFQSIFNYLENRSL